MRFTTTDLKDLGKLHKDISAEYQRHQQHLLDAAVAVMGASSGGGVCTLLTLPASYTPAIEDLAAIVAEIDVLASFATVAATAPSQYVRPTMLPAGSGVLKLADCRHPCLEAMDDTSFVPNTLEMDQGACPRSGAADHTQTHGSSSSPAQIWAVRAPTFGRLVCASCWRR